MCSDNPNTIIIRTDGVNKIGNLDIAGDEGSVEIEAGKNQNTKNAPSFLLTHSYRCNISTVASCWFHKIFIEIITLVSRADWLHERGASMSYTLVNWNITIGGSLIQGYVCKRLIYFHSWFDCNRVA